MQSISSLALLEKDLILPEISFQESGYYFIELLLLF